MIIRKYQPSDCKELADLFYNTVHTVNAKDYTKEQLNVWATGQVDLEQWNKSLQEHFSVVAVDDEIIGFYQKGPAFSRAFLNGVQII